MTFYSDLLTLIDSRAESEYTGSVEECGHLQPYLLSLRKLLEIRANLIRGGSTLSFYTELLTDIETRIETSYEGLLSELGDNAPNALSLPALLQLRDYLNASEGGGGGGSGKLLNTAFTHLTTTSSQSIPVNTSTNITGMNCSITPTNATSKILVQMRWNGASELGAETGNVKPTGFAWQIKRGSTVVGVPEGSRFQRAYIDGTDVNVATALGYYHHTNLWYLDSPNTTSPLTYSLAAFMATDSVVLYTNRSELPLDDDNVAQTSSILLMEIAP